MQSPRSVLTLLLGLSLSGFALVSRVSRAQPPVSVPLAAVWMSSSTAPCNGIHLRGGAVLTVRHCVEVDQTFLRLDDLSLIPAKVGWTSQVMDLALLKTKGTRRGLRVASTTATAQLDSQDAWVATREHGLAPARIVSVDEQFVRVTAPGAALCFGDSGSPLLLREGKELVVVGVLDVGDKHCAPDGLNRFVRVDRGRIPHGAYSSRTGQVSKTSTGHAPAVGGG